MELAMTVTTRTILNVRVPSEHIADFERDIQFVVSNAPRLKNGIGVNVELALSANTIDWNPVSVEILSEALIGASNQNADEIEFHI